MMGRKVLEPKRRYEFSLDERVPADHVLHQVTTVVNFSFARRVTARFYSRTGAPSVDPVVLVKMALLGYLYGITGERRLAAEVRLHLAFMWFIGSDLDEVPPVGSGVLMVPPLAAYGCRRCTLDLTAAMARPLQQTCTRSTHYGCRRFRMDDELRSITLRSSSPPLWRRSSRANRQPVS